MSIDNPDFHPEILDHVLEYRLVEFQRPPSELQTQEKATSIVYENGLIVGRFQPLHYGHIYLMEQGLMLCEKITIGIGSANLTDADNPFPVEDRERRLKNALERLGMSERVAGIVKLNDFYDDSLWTQEIFRKTQGVGNIDVAIGHNPWTNRILSAAGIPVLDDQVIPMLDRSHLQGTKIRKILRDEKLIPKE